MKAVFTKTLVNNVYSVELSTAEFDTADTDLFADFGEPVIDIGGIIKNSSDATVATLPSNFRKVQTQLPVTMRFSEAQYPGTAKDIANAWVLTIEGRLDAVMTAIRAKLDDFSGTQETII